MKPSLPVTAVLALVSLALLVSPGMADDCGCGGLPDFYDPSPPPSDPSDSGGTSPGGSSGGPSGGAGSGDSSGDSPPGDSSSGSSGSPVSGTSGTSAEALFLEARRLLGQGMYNESLAAYTRVVGADPASFAAWMEKGRVEALLGMHDQALASFARAARIKPADTDPLVSRGEVYLAMGDTGAAIAAFDRALVIHPGLPAALDGKARAEEVQQLLAAAATQETPASQGTGENIPATSLSASGSSPAGDGETGPVQTHPPGTGSPAPGDGEAGIQQATPHDTGSPAAVQTGKQHATPSGASPPASMEHASAGEQAPRSPVPLPLLAPAFLVPAVLWRRKRG